MYFYELVIAVVLISIYYVYVVTRLYKFKSSQPDFSSAINFMLLTLTSCFIGMWCLISFLSNGNYAAIAFMVLFGFFGTCFSIVAIYKASYNFFTVYKYIGNEKTAHTLLWGYVPFTVMPGLIALVNFITGFGFALFGFFLWNFISDTIMEVLFYIKLRSLKYRIGSDIEASMVALKALQKMFIYKSLVVALAILTISGFFTLFSLYGDVEVGLYLFIYSIMILIPTSAILFQQRLYCTSLIPKVSLGESDLHEIVKSTDQVTFVVH